MRSVALVIAHETLNSRSQSGEAGVAAGTSELRNNAFARIMNRPERSQALQSVKPAKNCRPAETEYKQEQASAGEVGGTLSATVRATLETTTTMPHNLEIERGNRMIEKLMGSKLRPQARHVMPYDAPGHAVESTEPVAVAPAPAPAPNVHNKTMTVLERIEETLREEMNTTGDPTPSFVAPEAPVTDHAPLVDLEGEVSNDKNSIKSEVQDEIAAQPESLMAIVIAPAEVDSCCDSSGIELPDNLVADAILSLPQTPVRTVSEPDQVDQAVSIEITQLALPEKLQQEWVDEEPPIAVPIPKAPSAKGDLQR